MSIHPNLLESLIGNQHYKSRKRHGRKKKFETPEKLWQAACSYFEYVKANPFEKVIHFKQKDKIITSIIEKERPLTITGLCAHLRVSRKYLNQNNDPEFKEMICMIRDVIFVDQFQGACTGIYNSSIIARSLSLKKEAIF